MLPIVVERALSEAGVTMKDISAIAIAKEPGLPPALVVGYAYASGLALANKIQLADVNHLDAHISGIWLATNKKDNFYYNFK